jgi:hypothetical protein
VAKDAPAGAVPSEVKDRRELTTRIQRVWLDDEGIVRALIFAGTEQTRADAAEAIAAVGEIAGHRRRPLLVDLRATKSMDRGARAEYAGEAAVAVNRAVALLVGSPLTRVIASFFMGLGKPTVPTRMFTSEAEALAWLRTFLE